MYPRKRQRQQISGGAGVEEIFMGMPVSDASRFPQPQAQCWRVAVKGHWRTMPNDTCLDNIRGCRSGRD
jgi:hypothetical protein